MLTTGNSGKYLTKTWNEMRAKALIDRSGFTEAQLEWLEIGADESVVSSSNESVYQVDTQPVDPSTSSEKTDIRNNPINGGK